MRTTNGQNNLTLFLKENRLPLSTHHLSYLQKRERLPLSSTHPLSMRLQLLGISDTHKSIYLSYQNLAWPCKATALILFLVKIYLLRKLLEGIFTARQLWLPRHGREGLGSIGWKNLQPQNSNAWDEWFSSSYFFKIPFFFFFGYIRALDSSIHTHMPLTSYATALDQYYTSPDMLAFVILSP